MVSVLVDDFTLAAWPYGCPVVSAVIAACAAVSYQRPNFLTRGGFSRRGELWFAVSR
jgi:hypothetical protein